MPSKERVSALPLPPIRWLLHGLSAAIILWLMVSGFAVVGLDRGSALRLVIDTVNPVLGAFFVPIFIARAVLYLRTRPFHQWDSVLREQQMMVAGQVALYVCIFVVLLTGLLMMPAGWKLMNVVPAYGRVVGDGVRSSSATLHFWTDGALACLVAGHVAMVVAHEMRGRPVLYRVLPSRAANNGNRCGRDPQGEKRT
ncbi:cytochrome b/b6 domain-containing protein [Gluconacetobacter sacchari]|uniref:cytochrome b/b6 domain-containing protein n=1 Tax=Gluconacetobacter sacchari TaxID=92759 RepID=UPI002231AED5|nr:cytochrome b/b6 domain-containing protein [Gluconacetobacter sacchari]